MPESASDRGVFFLNPEGLIESGSWHASKNVCGSHFLRLLDGMEVPDCHPDLLLAHALKVGRSNGVRTRIRADGSSPWATLVLAPVFKSSGDHHGFMLSIDDALEGERAMDGGKKTERARDEFCAIVVHEFRTPLTVLSLRLESLRTNAEKCWAMPAPDREMLLSSLTACATQSRRLSRLLNGLLDFVLFRAGKCPLNRRRVDLTELVQGAIDLMSQEFGACPSVRFHHAGPVVGNWDADRIEQVITNLLSNAVKYGKGSPIDVTLVRDSMPAQARFVVADQGDGISAEFHGRIFDPFERGGGASGVQGLGLGLNICRQIVESHGGGITFESKIGEGAAFTVALPLADPG